ncbi:MAG: hypothetical protein ACT4P7_07985 [Gemmatimonadaceae bacterium]
MRTRVAAVLLSAAVPGTTGLIQAQAPALSLACARLTFGPWSPPLNWSGAGHADSATQVAAMVRRIRDSVYTGRTTAMGRDEMQWIETNAGRRLMLYPSWWPAGVMITFDSSGDTVSTSPPGDVLTGAAVGLVADAAQPQPRAAVRVVHMSCPSHGP